MIVHGYNCSKVYVEIISSEQTQIDIYAPGNGGKLVYEVEGDFYSNWLKNINIYSNPGTYDIIVDSSKCMMCSDININGTFVTHELNVTCGGESSCQDWNISCPSNAACNVYCSSQQTPKGIYYVNWVACYDMYIFAPKGTYDVNWVCDSQ
eukprot:432721_1